MPQKISSPKNSTDSASGQKILRDKAEYGDFQTPLALARQTCLWLKAKGFAPDVLVEPTFGHGHFIIAALETFPSLKFVYGVEIHEPYYRETQKILAELQIPSKPNIHLYHDDVFRFSFSDVAKQHKNSSILVLGNPPWVTNSLLGSKNSDNVPQKSNFKNVRGIDAITGKGNFDLGESVTLAMLKAFADSKGCLAFLVKNSVVKNIVHSQQKLKFSIAHLQYVSIDTKKEFNASVAAGLFFADFHQQPEYECFMSSSFGSLEKSRFGWYRGKFVSNIEKYSQSNFFDGCSPTVWRQGIKHDCSSVMELTSLDGMYKNGLGETVDIE